MANPTTNFGWVMPTATDLVTDLPADFAVFGQGVDTSMAYLLGGTTGQILSKTSATNMAFTWINNDQGDITGVTAGTGISGGGTSGTVTVTNSMATAIDAKGDLVVGTGADTFSRLAVGTDTYLLTADSAEATGLKWAAAAGGGTVIKVVYGSTTTSNSISSTSFTDTNLTASITPTANTSKVLVLVSQQFTLTQGSGTGIGQKANLVRGATNIFTQPGAYQSGYYNPGTSLSYEVGFPLCLNYLDSPATTSSTTYKLQLALNTTANSAATICQHGSAISTMILIEIGA